MRPGAKVFNPTAVNFQLVTFFKASEGDTPTASSIPYQTDTGRRASSPTTTDRSIRFYHLLQSLPLSVDDLIRPTRYHRLIPRADKPCWP